MFADLCTDLESPRSRRVVTPPQDLHKVDLEVAVAKTPAHRAHAATRPPSVTVDDDDAAPRRSSFVEVLLGDADWPAGPSPAWHKRAGQLSAEL